jgi:hypothetical protein
MNDIPLADLVRAHLLAEWGRQSCRNPADWPDVLARLLRDGVGLANGMTRTGFAPRVDAAVAEITALFTADRPPAGAAMATWRAFPMLTRANAVWLAKALIQARAEAVP